MIEATSGEPRILVVDDNALNRQVAEGHLVSAGYAVSMAEDGERAVAAFQAWSPDLVLLDIIMPGMDGYETCKRLKALPGAKSVPVVFLTALGELSSHQKAIDSGADDFLTKPINRTELLIRIRSLLRLKQLSDELNQGYELIREQRDALLKLQKQKEELSALVVHDLKNPLTAILSNADYLASRPYLDEEDRAAMQDVLGSVESMRRMLMNLLDISRSEDGNMVPAMVDLDLEKLFGEVRAANRRRLEERSLAMEVNVQVERLRGDRGLLQRLLENLLDNVIKYSPSGGIITLEARWSANSGAEDLVEIRVSDQGPGIPPVYRERIFEKYFQLDRTADPAARTSRGLGLAFCRLAAEAHGGRIWAQANDPRGTTFCVLLPAPGHALDPHRAT